MQTNLIKNDESLCIDNQQNSHCYKLQTANALIWIYKESDSNGLFE